MSQYSNGALISSSTKNACKRGCSTKLQQSNRNVLDGVLLHSLKSLSRRAFDYSQSIDQEGLLTCLLHLSLRVKSIMASAVNQMLHQDLNTSRGLEISDPHHFVATSHLRGLLNTSISLTPTKILNFGGTLQFTPISRNPRGLSNHHHFAPPPTMLYSGGEL